MKIHWKLIIYQNFRVVFRISRPGNIPQKCFSTQNEPLGVTFQMRLTPTMEASDFWRNLAKTTVQSFLNHFKRLHHGVCLFFPKNKQIPWLGSVSFETWHPKVRFEYWTIFEGYLWAEIFEKEIWPLCQSLILNVNSHIFKIKDKSKWK